MTTTSILLALVAAVVWGIARIVRWWKLPEVSAARASRAIERQKQRTERLKIRRTAFTGRRTGIRVFGNWFGRRKDK